MTILTQGLGRRRRRASRASGDVVPSFANPYTDWWASGLAADGATLTEWVPNHDDLGRGALTQAIALKQPVFREADASMGSQGTVEFDGVDDALRQAHAVNAQPNTIILVARMRTVAGWFCDGDTDNGARHAFLPNAGSWGFYAGGVLSTGVATDTSPHLFIGKSLDASGNGAVALDGNPYVTGHVGTQPLGGLAIGAGMSGNANWSPSNFAYVAVVDGDITADEREQCEILAATCGVTI